MRIAFSPQRRNDALSVFKAGDILTINGQLFDFTVLPDGATIPAGKIPCDWVLGPVKRIDGDLNLTLILPFGANPSDAVLWAESSINPPDGELALPFDSAPVDAEENEMESADVGT